MSSPNCAIINFDIINGIILDKPQITYYSPSRVGFSSDRLYVEFGRLVEENRRRQKITQADLAKRVHLTRTSISNIECGRQQVYLHTLYLLSDALGIEAKDLLPNRSSLGEELLRVRLEAEELAPDDKRRIMKLLRSPR